MPDTFTSNATLMQDVFGAFQLFGSFESVRQETCKVSCLVATALILGSKLWMMCYTLAP
jgi:hypothetical protein